MHLLAYLYRHQIPCPESEVWEDLLRENGRAEGPMVGHGDGQRYDRCNGSGSGLGDVAIWIVKGMGTTKTEEWGMGTDTMKLKKPVLGGMGTGMEMAEDGRKGMAATGGEMGTGIIAEVYR